MRRELLYSGLALAVFAAGCPTAEKEQRNEAKTVQRTTAENKGQQDPRKIKYENGIEARITYSTGPGDIVSLRIEVDKDPNNVIGKAISESCRPENIAYELMVDGRRRIRAVTSKIDGLTIRMVSDDQRGYMKTGQKGSHTMLPMDPQDRKIVGKVEAALDVYSLTRK